MRVISMAIAFKQFCKGGTLAAIGYLLSPLSWWNDLFVNVPLALAFAWIISLPWPAAFAASFVVGYWLTNILGFVLMHKGAAHLAGGSPAPYSRRDLVRDVLISLAYTALIVALVQFRFIQPLPSYLPQR
jgi:hypothetical protein